MSTTTKSPRKVLVTAWLVAQRKLPAYRHRFSPQKFTQHQLFACLVLKTFLRRDYRGIVALLEDCPELRRAIDMSHVPHYTTLQKAAERLLCHGIATQLLDGTVETIRKNTHIRLAAIDSTGLEAGHTSKYFVRRKHPRKPGEYEHTHYRRWPKLSVSSDCGNHLILSVVTTRGPSPDINMFKNVVIPAAQKYLIDHLLADAGYDSEANHRFAREQCHIRTAIPPTHGRQTDKPLRGKYRRQMQKRFPKKRYGQRWQVETIFSMLKRNFGEAVHARRYWAQCREMMLLVLTHNIGVVLLVKELFYRAFLTPLILSPCLNDVP
jgi:transposase